MSTEIDWDGRSRQPCPACDKGPRDDSLMVWQADGNAFCHRCGSSFFRDDRPHHAPAARAPRAPTTAEISAEQWKRVTADRVWRDSRRITADTPAGRYLVEARAVLSPPGDSDLRWVERFDCLGLRGPALIGRMTLATDRAVMRGVHITGLALGADGHWHRTERRYLGPKSGCVVRLWPDEAVTAGLSIGEGIETCLAMAHAFTPVWACLDAGNLAAFPVLAGIGSLTIAADNDDAGRAAAKACAERWADAGPQVRVVMAPQHNDLNDLVRCAA